MGHVKLTSELLAYDRDVYALLATVITTESCRKVGVCQSLVITGNVFYNALKQLRLFLNDTQSVQVPFNHCGAQRDRRYVMTLNTEIQMQLDHNVMRRHHVIRLQQRRRWQGGGVHGQQGAGVPGEQNAAAPYDTKWAPTCEGDRVLPPSAESHLSAPPENDVSARHRRGARGDV